MRIKLVVAVFAVALVAPAPGALQAQEACPPFPWCVRCNKEIDGGVVKHWITASCPRGLESFWGWVQDGYVHGGPMVGGCVDGEHGHELCDGAAEEDVELLAAALVATDPATVEVALARLGSLARPAPEEGELLILTCDGDVQRRLPLRLPSGGSRHRAEGS